MGGYCGMAFKSFQGVTQGEPLYLKFFNVVLDTVVLHWVLIVAEGEEVP